MNPFLCVSKPLAKVGEVNRAETQLGCSCGKCEFCCRWHERYQRWVERAQKQMNGRNELGWFALNESDFEVTSESPNEEQESDQEICVEYHQLHSSHEVSEPNLCRKRKKGDAEEPSWFPHCKRTRHTVVAEDLLPPPAKNAKSRKRPPSLVLVRNSKVFRGPTSEQDDSLCEDMLTSDTYSNFQCILQDQAATGSEVLKHVRARFADFDTPHPRDQLSGLFYQEKCGDAVSLLANRVVAFAARLSDGHTALPDSCLEEVDNEDTDDCLAQHLDLLQLSQNV